MTTAAPGTTPAERWSGRDLTLAQVCRQLGRLRDPDGDGRPFTLASTLTLIAYAPRPEDVPDMEAVLARMADHQPSRAVLVALEPGGARGLDASILSAQRPGCQDRCVWVELVTLRLRGVPVAAAASAVVPLLRFDLPTFLWWPTAPDPDAHPALPALAALADRLVSESDRADDATAAVAQLAGWCGTGGPAPTDLAWAELTPWRQLVAQLVDTAALWGLRAGPARLTLGHPGPAPTVEALLMAGWLRDVLGDGLSVTLLPHCGAGARGVGAGLVTLELVGQAGRTLAIARTAARDTAEVIVTEAGGRSRRRVLPMPRADRAGLLAGELELQHADRPFERAVPHALAIARAAP